MVVAQSVAILRVDTDRRLSINAALETNGYFLDRSSYELLEAHFHKRPRPPAHIDVWIRTAGGGTFQLALFVSTNAYPAVYRFRPASKRSRIFTALRYAPAAWKAPNV